MINFNGRVISGSESVLNRAFLYGDGVFETMRISRGKILFFEDHYFRLMSAMRICRMEIPMSFTMEYLENQVLELTSRNGFENARVRLTVYRSGGGYYLPESSETEFVITASALDSSEYSIASQTYEADLYRDFHIPAQLLSTVKTTNRMINVTASIYASENGLDDCLLINGEKNVVEAISANVFIYSGGRLITPPVSEGCVNGVMRKQILALAKKEGIEAAEEIVSPFEIQRADEVFLTNVIKGIQPITKYRKKEYGSDLSKRLLERLNGEIS